ncbi:MAG: peptidylprolyl isomerase [Alphaproteobacteria bacterium]|nr:peptidylprolyl isomerase [Alphaproteobacteria bacterium]
MPIRAAKRLAATAALALALAGGLPLAISGLPAPLAPAPASAQENRVAAVVNSDAITLRDLQSRRRLFQITSRLPDTPEVRERLTPQILRLLIDERLRLQEMRRRRIAVLDEDIAGTLRRIEQQNGLPEGGLVRQLRSSGVDPRTLIDQLRVQIGWTRLVRARIGDQAAVSDDEAEEALARLRAQVGQPEYLVSEIFLPIDNPDRAGEVQRFASGIIEQLRRGAPFAVLASQFSQGASADQGGDLGWVQAGQVDEEVEKVITQMPPGAISNPIRTAGGLSIVALRAKRAIGQSEETVYTMRQVFRPWPDGQNPDVETVAALQRAVARASNCAEFEGLAAQAGSTRPADPGPVSESQMPGPLRAFMAQQPVNRPSQPIIATDGVAIVMICNKEREGGLPSKEQIANSLLRDRLELMSRQMVRELRRRAFIEVRLEQNARPQGAAAEDEGPRTETPRRGRRQSGPTRTERPS